jgi:hypothetical protein
MPPWLKFVRAFMNWNPGNIFPLLKAANHDNITGTVLLHRGNSREVKRKLLFYTESDCNGPIEGRKGRETMAHK